MKIAFNSPWTLLLIYLALVIPPPALFGEAEAGKRPAESLADALRRLAQEKESPAVWLGARQAELLQEMGAGEGPAWHPPRDETTNCAFGDDDLRTLYVTAGGALLSTRVRVPGRPAWPVPMQP